MKASEARKKTQDAKKKLKLEECKKAEARMEREEKAYNQGCKAAKEAEYILKLINEDISKGHDSLVYKTSYDNTHSYDRGYIKTLPGVLKKLGYKIGEFKFENDTFYDEPITWAILDISWK